MTDIAFLHVPKCAGMSVKAQIGAQYSASDISPFAFEPNPSDVTEEYLDSVSENVRGHTFDGRNSDAAITALSRYPVVMGHFHLDTLLGIKPTRLVLILREPRARLLSHYTYWRSWGDDEYASFGSNISPRLTRDLSFLDFLVDPRFVGTVDNLAARMLLPRDMVTAYQALDPRLITEYWSALAPRLNRITDIGLTETIDHDMTAAGFSSGAPLGRVNSTPATPQQPEGLCPPGSLDGTAVDRALVSRTWLDRRLYWWANGQRINRGHPSAPHPDVTWGSAQGSL